MDAKNNGFVFAVIINAMLGNMSVGFFFALILPFALTVNQKGNTEGKQNS